MTINMTIGNYMIIITTTQLIIMLNIVDIIWPTIKNLNKYENVTKFNTYWPAFNLGLALV
jgi:hypothetical protein